MLALSIQPSARRKGGLSGPRQHFLFLALFFFLKKKKSLCVVVYPATLS